MNEFTTFPWFIVILIIISVGEMMISGFWLPIYYQYGVPLFRKEYSLMAMPDLAAKIPELEQKLKRSFWRPSVVFHVLNKNEIAFRNNFGSKNALSGLIRLDPNRGRMYVTGHLYWTLLLSPFILILIGISSPMSMQIFFLLFLLIIFTISFGMQRYHYTQIAAIIMETAVAKPLDNHSTPTSYAFDYPVEKPIETVLYEPEYMPHDPLKPQSGLNTGMIVLLALFVALGIAGAVAFWLLG